MKPIIGITPNITNDESTIQLNIKYCEAIQLAGGIPVIITYKSTQDIIDKIDGILLTGGGDVDPLIFGEQPEKKMGDISPLRDIEEIELCKTAIKNNIPILGICRGCQILAISLGGKIYQDIDDISNIKHSQKAPKYYPSHTIEIKNNTLLKSIYNKNILDVNSFHHQAIKDCGNDLIISALSKDNIIEAIEHKYNKFALGVQWHPETMFDKYNIHLKLFETFIKYAEK